MAVDPFTLGLIVKGVGTAVTTGMSIGQAAKQKRLQAEAEQKAASAMAEARKRLDVNVYESLGIPKEVYELEREALLQQGQLALQAGMEGQQRGIAATAGRVQLAQQRGQAGVRSQMAKELYGLERMTAQEEGRLRDMGFQLDLAEAEGAQIAAGQAEQARQRALAGVAAGVQQLGQLGMEAMPLYGKTAAGRETSRLITSAERSGDTFEDMKAKIASRGVVGGVDYGKVADMDRMQFEAFMEGADPQFIRGLKQTFYVEGVDPFNPYTFDTPTIDEPIVPSQTTIPTQGYINQFDAFNPFKRD